MSIPRLFQIYGDNDEIPLAICGKSMYLKLTCSGWYLWNGLDNGVTIFGIDYPLDEVEKYIEFHCANSRRMR